LLVGVLAPLVGDVEGRVRLHGPRVQLSPHEALGMTMVVHELGTNALKYGSLGSPGGRVELTWVAGPTAAGRALDVTWREKDGPPVIPPDGKTGFGTRLIDRALSGFGRTAVEFDPSGLICRIEILTTEAALRPVEEMSPAVG
jgi:two-component sensor histidine kinase